MSSLIKIGIVVLLLIVVLLTTGGYALFHGYFDHGLFELKQVEKSPHAPQRVAIVAERSDNRALSGDVYFVVIAQHVLSATELRRTYYSDDVVFAAAKDCLRISWTDSNQLLISCSHGIIDQAHIEVRKTRSDEVAITYENIAEGTAKDYKP